MFPNEKKLTYLAQLYTNANHNNNALTLPELLFASMVGADLHRSKTLDCIFSWHKMIIYYSFSSKLSTISKN